MSQIMRAIFFSLKMNINIQQARMFLNLVFFVFFEANFFKWRMVQRNCELLCQNVSFYAAHAVSDGGSNHWDIFWKGKSFSLHQKLNWRDGRLIISDSDCCLISDGDSNQWDQFLKRQEFFKHKNCFSLHLKLKKKKTLLCLAISSFNIRIIFCLLTLRFCIQRSWGLCAILLYPTSRLHSYPLSQTSWLPARWEWYWK